ncbi:hypothetical protein D3C74_229170 [compost metagenome]
MYRRCPSRFVAKAVICSILLLQIMYFGNKDGVYTMATGHPSVRKLDNPKLWDDQEWVDGVMERLEQ